MKGAGTLVLRGPRDFSFWHTAYSHGWCDLVPFSFDAGRQQLARVLQLPDGTLVHCTMRAAPQGIRIVCTGPASLTPEQRKHTVKQLRSCLRLDEDFTPFHKAMRRHTAFRWIARRRAGRLLRAPTMFEDAVKMICTTNCTWQLTVLMVRRLVEAFGRRANGLTAFPLPEALAGSSEEQLRRRCSTGYRARALLELADRVASGSLPVEEWRCSPLPTRDLYAEMCDVRGIGPYAAGNLLKLVGRYDYLGLDSWVRKQWSRIYTRGRAVRDKRIEDHYEPYGTWKGLVFWLEMTRDWHGETKPAPKKLSAKPPPDSHR